MKYPKTLAVVAVLLVFLALAGVKALQIRSMIAAGATMQPPPEAVTSATAREETWQPLLSAIGSISAVQGVTISAELPGKVEQIAFESGAVANKGDLLVQLDVSAEEAQLRASQSDVELAQRELDRAKDLQQRKVIAKSDFDAAEAKFAQTTAQVENMRAALAKKTIRAPFAGRLGIRKVNIGQTLNAGDEIVSLQSLDPVYADFALPQQTLAQLTVGLSVQVTTDAYPGQTFNGKLTALGSSLDPATRSVPVQATLENKDERLKPAMFAKVQVVLPQNEKVLVVPATAVLYAPYGDSVYVIESKKDEKTGKDVLKIHLRTVQLGETRGDFVAVTKGLKAGEQIVTSGLFKLRNDAVVEIHNELAPNAELAPKPADT